MDEFPINMFKVVDTSITQHEQPVRINDFAVYSAVGTVGKTTTILVP